MGKFSNNNRNQKLVDSLEKMPVSAEAAKASTKIPNYNAKNRQGYNAYGIEDELRLVSMLNTLKLENQFYRSDKEQMKEIQDLVEKIAGYDDYFVAQAIVWSRCLGEGMRSINHVAAAVLAPLISGKEWTKRFYSLFSKKTKSGGCIYRPDDMMEIKSVYETLGNTVLSNGMKKGFAKAIESLDNYQLAKYKKDIIDLANLCHPSPERSQATFKDKDGNIVKTLDAIMKGQTVIADTWESAQSEAGQIVAEAVRSGKLTKEKAEEVLKEAKNDNWESLLNDGKLGILAALRNLSNMLIGGKQEVIDKVCKLVSNEALLKAGKIMPYQIDFAYETLMTNSGQYNNKAQVRQVISALEDGIEKSTSNLKELLTGNNLVIVDCSGSMGTRMVQAGSSYNSCKYTASSCADKAALISAMILKATNADLIEFGSSAKEINYNPRSSVFEIARQIKNTNMGGTNLASAFQLITGQKKKYDRIFILSDNECNSGYQKDAYKSYVRTVANPYIYSIDLAAYGTKPIDSDRVHYFFGYGYAMFDTIAQSEFNPSKVIDEIRKIVI
jgi:hypothetical protein